MRHYLAGIMVLTLVGCQPPDATLDQSPGTDTTGERGGTTTRVSTSAPWTGMVWMRTDPADLPGVMRIFLADGTLVMDSCWETYRLARWEAVSDTVLVWQEDTAEIEAHLASVGGEEMRLRLVLAGDTLEEQYRAARVPYVCPDMER